jgi:hypothetical protein
LVAFSRIRGCLKNLHRCQQCNLWEMCSQTLKQLVKKLKSHSLEQFLLLRLSAFSCLVYSSAFKNPKRFFCKFTLHYCQQWFILLTECFQCCDTIITFLMKCRKANISALRKYWQVISNRVVALVSPSSLTEVLPPHSDLSVWTLLGNSCTCLKKKLAIFFPFVYLAHSIATFTITLKHVVLMWLLFF